MTGIVRRGEDTEKNAVVKIEAWRQRKRQIVISILGNILTQHVKDFQELLLQRGRESKGFFPRVFRRSMAQMDSLILVF